jgi:hypothetical protein
MYLMRNLPKVLLFLVAAAILFSVGSASGVEKPLQGEAVLLDIYHKNIGKLEAKSFGLPLILESFELDDRVHVDVFGKRGSIRTRVYALSGGKNIKQNGCIIN